MIIYESLRVKVLKTLLTIFCFAFFYYVVQFNGLIENFPDSWQLQTAVVVGMAVVCFTWLECKLEFDEMMQMLSIRRGLTRVLPTTKVSYSDIDKIILKRHAHQDEDGNVTNEGYFHLQLNNGKALLMMVFNDLDVIDNALKRLKKHTRLKITTF